MSQQPNIMQCNVIFAIFRIMAILIAVSSISVAQMQSVLAPTLGEVIFKRHTGGIIDPIEIKVELAGVLFNELGEYSTAVSDVHPAVVTNRYNSGKYLLGTGSGRTIVLPKEVNADPAMITWESAYPGDTEEFNNAYGNGDVYCDGMLGWGRYKVTLSVVDGSDLVFYLNTLDGNWMKTWNDIVFDLDVQWDIPVCKVSTVNGAITVNNLDEIGLWTVAGTPRERSEMKAGWDYSTPGETTLPFIINNAVPYYPLAVDNAVLDVNAVLTAATMRIYDYSTFSVKDWVDDNNQAHSTTLTVEAGSSIEVFGGLLLSGTVSGALNYNVVLQGAVDQRGYWDGIVVYEGGTVSSNGAHIANTVIAVDLQPDSYLYAGDTEIRSFAQYGIRQKDARAKVMSSFIHDGSIGVYAKGECWNTYYGWMDGEVKNPVEIYECDGHGVELDNVQSYYDNGQIVDQQKTFTIQFSEIHHNQLYGIWVHGEGSPLINNNYIYENGLYGGQAPSHDGVHVNMGEYVSIHDNFIYGNAYGSHHNDGGFITGETKVTAGITTYPQFIADAPHGNNCFFENTINAGVNRNATTIYGLGPSGYVEPITGAPRKYSGSNVFQSPTSGVQASNGTGTFYAEHNCWSLNNAVNGTILFGGDFADCNNDLLPDCVPAAPAMIQSNFVVASSANAVNSNSYLSIYSSLASKKQSALSALRSVYSPVAVRAALSDLAIILGVNDDQSVQAEIEKYLQYENKAWVYSSDIRHAALTALLYKSIANDNYSEALWYCDQYPIHFGSSEYSITGLLFKAKLLSEVDSTIANAESMLLTHMAANTDDSEALALYYSITHHLPYYMPKQASVPEENLLVNMQCYPNPFNPSINIEFEAVRATTVKLYITDVLGAHITTIYEGEVNRGTHTYTYSATNIGSGKYLCVIETSSGSRKVRPISFIK